MVGFRTEPDSMIGHVPADGSALLAAPEQKHAVRISPTQLGRGVCAALLGLAAFSLAYILHQTVNQSLTQPVASTCSNGFPTDFIWGLGTAAYQVEGAWNLTNRQPSIWDTFSHQPGRVYAHETGDVTIDMFHHWRSDIALMKQLGLKHYRFSIAWSRLMTWDGNTMVPNEEGITWYSSFLDGLIAAGIEAHVTLYHWDLPQALHDHKGGWHTPKNDQIVQEFAKYATLAFERFGGRVTTWFTFNEPWTFTVSGYSLGLHAPGCAPEQKSMPCANSDIMPYIVSTNVLNAHALAVWVYRNKFAFTGRISITLNCEMAIPLTSSDADAAAAERAVQFWLGWWLQPILTGEYPSVMRQNVGDRLPNFTASEQEMLIGSIDLLGMNHYSTHLVRDVKEGERGDSSSGWEADQHVVTSFDEEWPKAASPWQRSYPPGIRLLLNWVAKRYKGEIYVTENGWSCNSFNVTAAIQDQEQVDYFAKYTEQVRLALVEDGVRVRGYFGWSIFDNFEWADGYSKRFGIFFVDYKTQVRTPKAAAKWWKETRSTC